MSATSAQINIEALVSARALVALERRSWALTSAHERSESAALDERSRALVSKTGLVTSGHYLLFFDRRRALVTSAHEQSSGLRSSADILVHERSLALVSVRERLSARERSWVLES